MHAYLNGHLILYRMAILSMFACSLPFVVDKVARPPRSMHTAAMPRSIIIPLSDADVLKQTLRLYIISDKRATYEIGREIAKSTEACGCIRRLWSALQTCI